MCGIAGYILKRPVGLSRNDIDSLMQPIRPRGPDDEGVCLVQRDGEKIELLRTDNTVSQITASHINNYNATAGHHVALLHTRYSIIDLSSRGHQPFVSGDERYVIIFNGEIYNYLELKEELEKKGCRFRTHTDTEVIIEAYRVWGAQAWTHLNGFWALALYDRKKDELVLSRDRLGKAPLYYTENTNGLYFSSSINSLLPFAPNGTKTNTDVVFGFIETSLKDYDCLTCYKDIYTFPAASVAKFVGGVFEIAKSEKRKYWSFPTARYSASDISFGDAVSRYRDLFFDAVRLRLRADVPVAFELSGGLDSSAIVASAIALGVTPPLTFTIRVKRHDEEIIARKMLDMYSLDYRVLEKSEAGFDDESERFTYLMEEPYHSPNIYTHYAMRRIMKNQGAACVLTGAGGDELLGGYENLFWPAASAELGANGKKFHAYVYDMARMFGTQKRMAHTLRSLVTNSKQLRWRISAKIRQKFLPGTVKQVSGAGVKNAAMNYRTDYWRLPYDQQRLYHFNIGLLPYYLRSNDKFSMNIPIEQRCPMLDYRLVEFCMQLPVEYLFSRGWTKYLHRRAFEEMLPKEIVWRKDKMGFPFDHYEFLKKRERLCHDMCTTAGLYFGDTSSYSAEECGVLLQEDPVKLWRIVSVGLWLESLKSQMPNVS